MNFTIDDKEVVLSPSDISTIFYGITDNKVGHSLIIEWMENNYDKTLGYAPTIIDGFAISSNKQSDIDLINQFVSNHSQDMHDSMSAIQESIRKAELNVQWNNLHGEKVLEWLKENYEQRNIL